VAYRDPPEHVAYLIGDVSRIFRTVYDRRVEPLGLTRAQWRVLSRINRMEGATQTELASVLEIEKPTLGRLLDRLEDKGWVERTPDPHDGRTKRVSLTESAQPVLEEMYELGDEILDAAVSGLSEKEAKQLREALNRVKHNLSELLDRGANHSVLGT
jgi:MarR family transcriptional regulator for hemolysin